MEDKAGDHCGDVNEMIKPLRYIGGSDIAAILGISRWRTRRDVYNRIFGLAEEKESPAFEWGKRLEEVIANKFLDNHGDIEQGIFGKKMETHLEDGTWLGGEIDLCWRGGVAEIKTAGAHARDDWGDPADGADGCPADYVAQTRWYMMAADAAVGYIAVLIGGQDYREYFFGRDRDWEDAALQAACLFWQEYVVTLTPPPLEAKDDVTTVAADDAGIVWANADMEAEIEALHDAEVANEITARCLKEQQNRVKEFIGKNAGIDCPLGIVTWRADKNGKRTFRTKWKEAKNGN